MEISPEIIRFYTNSATEGNRLNQGTTRLEKVRTQEIILRYLTHKPSRVLDFGGATGVYSFWLSEMGHEVHLIDPVQFHIAEATKLSSNSKRPPASIKLGEARSLEFEDGYFDMILLLGPLYHLTQRQERLDAVAEAKLIHHSFCPSPGRV